MREEVRVWLNGLGLEIYKLRIKRPKVPYRILALAASRMYDKRDTFKPITTARHIWDDCDFLIYLEAHKVDPQLRGGIFPGVGL